MKKQHWAPNNGPNSLHIARTSTAIAKNAIIPRHDSTAPRFNQRQ